MLYSRIAALRKISVIFPFYENPEMFKEQQRGCRRAPNRNPTSGTKYYDVKAAHGLNSRHKEKLVERLNDAKEIQGMRGAA